MKKIYQKCGLMLVLGLSSAFSTDNLFIDEPNNATQQPKTFVSGQGDILLELEEPRKEAISSGEFKIQEPLPTCSYRTIFEPVTKTPEGIITYDTYTTCEYTIYGKHGVARTLFGSGVIVRYINK